MTTKLSELIAELSPGERREVNSRARFHIKAMQDAERLDQVRKAVNKTQNEIAASMGIGQNAVSQLEKRDDLQLSTLYRYVKSMGLHLELAVVGASGQRAVLKKFQPWKAAEAAAAKAAAQPTRTRDGTRKSHVAKKAPARGATRRPLQQGNTS